ncbi:MAG: Txe/YoeB family addiction module toxin [Candidatus Cloacimonetes bacterium]|nr:Txe/YoeB family addiction module toxin [Candidatus Cloacimonadota bacterium]
MRVYFSEKALQEYIKLTKTNKKIAERIALLIEEIEQNPTSGRGKPEMLKHELSGFWSRRIRGKLRLIYRIVDDESVEISSCCGYHIK